MILLVILLLCSGVQCQQDDTEQLRDLNYRCARDQTTLMESVLMMQRIMERHEEEMKAQIERHEEEIKAEFKKYEEVRKAEIKNQTTIMESILMMEQRMERQQKDQDELKAAINKILQNQQDILSQMPDSRWIVIQRRVDGEVLFNRSWAEYKEGFGDLEGSFWIGLEKLHNLTKHTQFALHVDITHFNGSSFYADYDNFRVGSEEEGYKIQVSGYSGTAGDALDYHNGMMFSAKDRDNDIDSAFHCGDVYSSGWWFKGCFEANLNGVYYDDPHKTLQQWNGTIWVANRNIPPKSLKFAQMKIKPLSESENL